MQPNANCCLIRQKFVREFAYEFAADHAICAAENGSRSDVVAAKSPRSAFSAYFSVSISRRVRTPLRRRIGTGGHHPSNACRRRKERTTQGTAKNFLLTKSPSTVPPSARADAFVSSQRSISHSLSSSWMC